MDSLPKIGALVAHDPTRNSETLSREVFLAPEQMRQCLFQIACVYKDPKVPYECVEDRIIKLGRDIIDAKWVERKSWVRKATT